MMAAKSVSFHVRHSSSLGTQRLSAISTPAERQASLLSRPHGPAARCRPTMRGFQRHLRWSQPYHGGGDGGSGRFKNDKALMDEIHRLTEAPNAHGGATLGPFAMPRGVADGKPLDEDELLGWSQVSWVERARRSIRLCRNLLIVGFGGGLGVLVVYSITSELFRPSSATNLVNSTIETLHQSRTLPKILRSPFKFHRPIPPPSSSSPHDLSSQPSFRPSRQLRFQIEGHSGLTFTQDWKKIEWWKSWIAPLITSEVYHPSILDSQPSSSSSPSTEEAYQGSFQKGWWLPGLLRSLMPFKFKSSAEEAQANQKGWNWFRKSLPSLGTFDRGEVCADLVQRPGNKWAFKSLYIDFPDSQNVKYRLDVLNELRQQQQPTEDSLAAEEVPTRYRFWLRRIQV